MDMVDAFGQEQFFHGYLPVIFLISYLSGCFRSTHPALGTLPLFIPRLGCGMNTGGTYA